MHGASTASGSTPRPTGLIHWLVLLGILSVAAASCASSNAGIPASATTLRSDPTPSTTQRPVVIVVGDSITDLTSAALHRRLDDDVVLAAEGVHGALAADMLPTTMRLADMHPDVAVINLGTNDATLGLATDVTEAALRDHLERLESAECRWLVTITERPGPPFRAAAHAINARLRAIAASEVGVGLVDWQAALDADSAAGSPTGPLLSDDIHPTGAGTTLLVDLLAAAIDSPCD